MDTAIAWQLRLAEADAAQWAEFVDWLEASPANAQAYDRVATADRLVAEARFPAPAVLAENDNAPTPRGMRWWIGGGAVAAAAAIALAVAPSMLPRSQPYQVATRDGERQTIALGDGTRIELSGGSQLTLDRANPRVASLDRGEALFHVRHDQAAAFTLRVGDVSVRDLGTVFNVARRPGRVQVAVAEGAVAFEPKGSSLTLSPGDALSAREDGSGISRSRVTPDLVGGWRAGRLSFAGQPLREVAGELKRLYGTQIALRGSLSERPFTGVVHLSGAADRDVPRLAELIGATWRRESGQWILAEQGDSAR